MRTIIVSLLLPLFCGISFNIAVAGEPGDQNTSPNILIITIDTLRADYLGIYGNREVSTPNIDSLARDGVLFRRCVAHCPLTLPSHVSIFTSTTPAVNGVHDNSGYRVKEEQLTFAEVCNENGYNTAAFVSVFVLDSRFGLDQGFEHYNDHIKPATNNNAIPERSAPETISAACTWLEKIHTDKKPWFMWVHLFEPHAPYVPYAPFDQKYAQNPYAGEVSAADHALGVLFDDLKKFGAFENTILLITSDHGEGLGEHGEVSHGTYAYNSTLHVPLIIRAPGLPRGTEVARRVRHIDLIPTLLELAGIAIPTSFEGESLVATANNGNNIPERDSYFEALQGWLDFGWAPLRGVYHGDNKFIDLPIAEFYSMKTDWDEQNNIINTNAQNARASLSLLKTYLADRESSERKHEEDLGTLKKLESLGYLNSSDVQLDKEKWTPEDDPKILYPIERKIDEAKGMDPRTRGAEAEQILRDIINKRPTTYAAYDALAFNLIRRGKGNEALALLEKSIRDGLDNTFMLKTYALSLFTLGSPHKALPIYKELAKRAPDDAELASSISSCLFQMNDLAGAENELRRALQLDPTFVQARVNLSWLLLRAGSMDKAEHEIDIALKDWPQFASAQEIKGIIRQTKGDNEAASQHLNAALFADPNRHLARYRLVHVYMALKDWQGVSSTIEDFLKIAPENRFQAEHRELRNLLELLKQKN